MDNLQSNIVDEESVPISVLLLGITTVVLSLFVPFFGLASFGGMVYLVAQKKNKLMNALTICVGIFLITMIFVYFGAIWSSISSPE